VIVMLVATPVACSTGGRSSGVIGSPSTTDPTLTPKQVERQPEVSILFSEQAWARGMRRFLNVAVIRHPSDVCANYGFRSKMTMLVAYQSDCSSFTGDRRNDLFFYVAVRNVTGTRSAFDLSNFTLDSQDGRSFAPAPVGSSPPKDFLPETGTIGPHSGMFGYLAFDADATTVVPGRLSYADGDQTLSVVFDGEPAKA
jgi:hypothetical protein